MQIGYYRHFKGTVYQVMCIGTHTETGEELVVYQAASIPNGKIWIRPRQMFQELVTREIGGVVTTVPRFDFIGTELPPEVKIPNAH